MLWPRSTRASFRRRFIVSLSLIVLDVYFIWFCVYILIHRVGCVRVYMAVARAARAESRAGERDLSTGPRSLYYRSCRCPPPHTQPHARGHSTLGTHPGYAHTPTQTKHHGTQRPLLHLPLLTERDAPGARGAAGRARGAGRHWSRSSSLKRRSSGSSS